MTDLLLFMAAGLVGAAAAVLAVRLLSSRSPDGRVTSPVPEPHPSPRLDAESVLERLGEGVLILDEQLRPTYANSSARDMLGIQSSSLPGRVPSEEIAEVARRAQMDDGAERRVDVLFPLPMSLQVRATPLSGEGGLVVVIKDVTEESLTQRVRREFVTHASHELKSPVAGLQALAEAIQSAIRDDPASAERFAERMARESERLGRLVRDLLDLSRLEEATEIPSENVNLSRAATKALEQVGTQIESKEMDLVTDIEEEVWLHGDEEQLRMMIQNLLENAVRYTPKFGSIRFRVAREDEDAIVSVKDSGMGIPAESHSRVFERFYRVDRARSRDRGGTGLGLAIVKHVAELHGGGVNLSSEIGEGSTFSVHLPATEPAGETEPVSQKTGG